ncbi:MAG: hypothetical protein Q9201_001331 [Fulgogasparrea decipioides]
MRIRSTILPILLLLSTLLSCCLSRPPECDARTRPPRRPSLISCDNLLWTLRNKADQEPPGAYKWYGRHLDPCDQCVELPAVIHFGRQQCAIVIDVDDEHEDDPSIFGLRDLWEALHDVIRVCWVQEFHNGRGYPGGQAAWAGFVRGMGQGSGVLWNDTAVLGAEAEGLWKNETERWGDRTMNVLDLSEGWPDNAVDDGHVGTVKVETA